MQGLEKEYPILILKSLKMGNCCSAQGQNLGKQKTETVVAYELLFFLSQKGLCNVRILRNQLQKPLGWLAEISFMEKSSVFEDNFIPHQIKSKKLSAWEDTHGMQLVRKHQFIASSDI